MKPSPRGLAELIRMPGAGAEAAKLFQRAIALHAELGWPWLGLGFIHLECGALEAAEWSFRQALELERMGLECPPGMAG